MCNIHIMWAEVKKVTLEDKLGLTPNTTGTIDLSRQDKIQKCIKIKNCTYHRYLYDV